MTTYRYLSLMRCSMDNPEWDDEVGDLSIHAGKRPETWMPNVFTDDDRVVGRRYERVALVKLPEWMSAEDAFEWVDEAEPDAFEDFYAAQEATA